ncbi:PH domain-containing protein [Candidatus Saccharibacteria bacterium]|nr:PH domain-containing protein [Candidatus Saccharibacteria bacterium]
MKKFYYCTARAAWRLILATLISAIMLLPINAALGMLPAGGDTSIDFIIYWTPRVYAAMAALCIALEALSIYARTYASLSISDSEVVFRRGWLSKSTTTIPARKIRSCSTHQTILQRICRTMSLCITTSGDGAEIYFVDVDYSGGRRAYKLLNQLAEASGSDT